MSRWFAVVLGFLCSVCVAEIPVTGRVLDQNHKPVAGAEATLFPIPNPIQISQVEMHSGGKPVAAARAVADLTGAYRLQAPGPGLWILRVEAPHFVPTETLLSPVLEEYDAGDALLDADAGLRVQVTDSRQKPVAGALVRIADQEQDDFLIGKPWKRAVRTAVTGDDGVAALPRAAKEVLVLSISAGNFQFFERKQPGVDRLAVALSAGTAQTLRVLDQAGKPVPGVLLRLGDAGHPVELTDELGLAHPRIAKGAGVPALVYAPDSRRYRWTLTTPGDPAKEIEVRLPDLYDLTGSVVDAEKGQPLDGAVVWSGTERWNQSITDKGRYRLRLPGGSALVRCEAAGYAQKVLQDVAVAPVKENRMTIALNPAAILEGVVVAPDQTPVPEAELKLDKGRAMQGSPVYFPQWQRKLRARRDGTFRIPGLDTPYNYRLTAESAGFAPAQAEFDVSSSMRIRRGIRLELKTGQSAIGVVTDAAGRPVAGAEVVAFASLAESSNPIVIYMPREELRRATTGNSGTFSLSGLGVGRIDLEVSARGYAKQQTSGLEVVYKKEPQDLGRFVLKPGVTLTGRVLNPGKQPVEGAQVRVGPADPNGDLYLLRTEEPDAVTSSDGWFSVEDQSEAGQVDVLVQREGYLELQLPAATVSVTEPLILTMHPASRVSGKILSDSGKPIAGTEIDLMKARQRSSFTWKSGTSDGDGSFEFKDVAPDTYSVAVKATGWQDYLQDGIVVAEGKDVAGLKVVMNPEALLEGTVTTPDGTPAIGATVERMVPGERVSRGQRSRAFSDGTGAYRLHGLKPGPASIQVSLERFPRLVKDVEIHSGSNRMDFQLEGGNNISGRVIDATGAPVPGATITVLLQPLFTRAASDTDGTFLLKGIPDGDFSLLVDKEGMTPEQEDYKVHVAGAPVEGLTIILHEGAVLSGSVLGLDAEKLPLVAIEAYDTQRGYRTTRPDSSGAFRISGIGPGHWTLIASLPGGSPQATGDSIVEPGMKEAHLDLKFGEGLKLSGTVLRGDEPQAGLTLWISGKDVDSSARATTDTAGRFHADGLARGQHQIAVFESMMDTNSLKYSGTVDLQQDQDIVIRIPETHVRGKVMDAGDGSAIAGVALTLTLASSLPVYPVPSAATASSTDGAFDFSNIAEGDWRLTATKDGYSAFTQSIRIQSEQNMDSLNISLQPTEGLTLEVHLAGGGIPDRVSYAALDVAGNTVLSGNDATSEGGRLSLRSLPRGGWQLLLRSLNSAVTSVGVAVPQTAAVAVTLLPACSIHIRVPELATEKIVAKAVLTDSQGRPYRDLSPYSGMVRPEQELYSGELTIDALPPGTWTVNAVTPDGRSWSGTAEAKPGITTELVLQ